MTELFVLALLRIYGLCSREEYEEKLHELFMRSENDDFLLELEGLTGYTAESLNVLKQSLMVQGADEYGRELTNLFRDPDEVAYRLGSKLAQAYRSGSFTLREFCERCTKLYFGEIGKIRDFDSSFNTLYIADEALISLDEEGAVKMLDNFFEKFMHGKEHYLNESRRIQL